MISTSTEFKQAHERNSACVSKASILLKDGTLLEIDNSQISQGATKIDDGVTGSNKFTIGSAISNKLTLSLNNRYDAFSDYDFTDAVVTVWVGKQLSDRIEWLKKGVYNTDDPTATPAILSLECLDNMSKFDTTYDGGIGFPATLQAIVQYCCTQCGVLLLNGEFPNFSYQVSKNPFTDATNITYRAIIAYCALLAGCYARCNADGRLEFKWYDTAAFDDVIDGGIFDETTEASYQTGADLDGGNFTDYSSGDSADGGTFTDNMPYHHIYSFSSLSVSTEDVVITGIRVTAADSEDDASKKIEGETYLCGAEGYVLDVSGNPLVEAGKAKEVAEYLAGRVVGMRFRPFQASAIGDPSWEAGDAAVVTDRKGNSYHTYLTNITYSTGGYASISCDAEPAARHSADRYAEINKIVSDIKKDSQQKLSEYADYVNQLNSLAVNAMGYYETREIQDDGSVITYMHDKPILDESKIVYKKSIDGYFWSKDGGKTWTGGVDKDGNAVMNVIAAIGISAEWINTRGLKATDDEGNVTFEVDAITGKVRIICEAFSLSGKTIVEITDEAVDALDRSLDMEGVLNRLTNNGAIQGIYMQSGQLYINAKYMIAGKLASKNGRVYFDLDNNELACSKMVSANDGQSMQTVADVGYPAGTSSTSGSRLRIYPQGHEESAVQIYANTSNMGYVEGPSEKMTVRCANARTLIDIYPEQTTLSAYPKAGSSSAKYAKVQLLSTGSSYSAGNVEISPCLSVKGPLTVSGTFTASGTKSRVIETENYSRRLQYCYEMATPMFGDTGEGETDENGECCVALDDVFVETVTTDIEYQAFLQKEGPGDLWIHEKYPTYFVVRGTENMRFAWEIKVKQKGFEYMRLENADIEEENIEAILSAYEENYALEITQFIKEQEDLLYETA